MDEGERLDVIAPGTFAIAGLMGLLATLARSGAISRADVVGIGDFMLAATDRSQATPQMQAHLHEALSHHLSTLLRELDEPGT